MYADGYKYWLAYKTNTTSYYRCCRYISSKCPGRCISEDGTVRNTTAHNHSPEPDRALVDKFRKILTQRAAAEKTELYAIYCDEATSRHSDAAMLYSFASAKSAMRKARRKQLPQTPNTVSDIVDILDTSDLFRVNSGSDKDSIYQKTIRLEDSICMIFLHRKTVDLFGRIEEVHVDGTMEFIPEAPPRYHLITAHAVQGYITAPIVYALLTAKTQSAYAALFAYIREELNILPNMVMSDFDQTMQATLAYVFPETVVKGCWFHYTDAVLAQMKCLNLQKETHKGVGASALRMLLVLPFLPAEYMSPGLDSLKKWMKEKCIFSDALSNLCDYVEYAWLRAVGAEKMSIFGTPRGISNHLKNFNKELSAIIGSESPAIWVVLESITQLATKIYVKINKKMRVAKAEASRISETTTGRKQLPGRLQRKNELFTETIISSATQLWIKTPVHLRNPLQFLQLSSHCINDSICLANLPNVQSPRSSASSALSRSPPSLRQQAAWSREKLSQSSQNKQHEMEQTNSCTSMDYFQLSQQQNLCSVDSLQGFCNNVTNEVNTSSTTSCLVGTQNLDGNGMGFSSSAVTSSNSNRITPVGTLQTVNKPKQQSTSSDPPPLAFFPAVKRMTLKRNLPILSEPPPLVPISSNYIKKKV